MPFRQHAGHKQTAFEQDHCTWVGNTPWGWGAWPGVELKPNPPQWAWETTEPLPRVIVWVISKSTSNKSNSNNTHLSLTQAGGSIVSWFRKGCAQPDRKIRAVGETRCYSPSKGNTLEKHRYVSPFIWGSGLPIVSAPPFINCVTSGKLLNLSVSSSIKQN